MAAAGPSKQPNPQSQAPKNWGATMLKFGPARLEYKRHDQPDSDLFTPLEAVDNVVLRDIMFDHSITIRQGSNGKGWCELKFAPLQYQLVSMKKEGTRDPALNSKCLSNPEPSIASTIQDHKTAWRIENAKSHPLARHADKLQFIRLVFSFHMRMDWRGAKDAQTFELLYNPIRSLCLRKPSLNPDDPVTDTPRPDSEAPEKEPEDQHPTYSEPATTFDDLEQKVTDQKAAVQRCETERAKAACATSDARNALEDIRTVMEEAREALAQAEAHEQCLIDNVIKSKEDLNETYTEMLKIREKMWVIDASPKDLGTE